MPIVQLRFPRGSGRAARQETESLRARAKALAEELPTGEGVDLLTVMDYATASSQQFDCLVTFANTVGRNAANPRAVHSRLLEGTFPAATYLLSGLLYTWPRECLAWLEANIGITHVAQLAIRIADEIPADRENAFLDAIIAQIAFGHDASATATGTEQVSGEGAPPDGKKEGGEPGQTFARLTSSVADHLGSCRARPVDKLARLVTLSSSSPDNALPRILAAVDTILSAPSGTQALVGVDNTLRRELAAILTRALAAADGAFGSEIDDDTATAAVALGRAAPAETAQILVERTLRPALSVIPHPWSELLVQSPPDQREPLASAYQELVQQHLGCLPAQPETAALDALDILSRGLPGWDTTIRNWSAGNAAERARTVIAIRYRWRDSIWREIVPALLDAGLSEQSATDLRQGIFPYNDAVDAAGLAARLDVLQPLLDDPRSVVRQFAAEAAQDLRAALAFFRHGDV